MDLPIVAAALLLPWILGSTMLGALRSPSRAPDAPGEIAWLAGAGWFVGAFALTLWMRVLSLAGVRFGLAAVALPLLAVALVLAALTWRRDGRRVVAAKFAAFRALVASPGLAGAARAFWWAAIAWLALRFALLALEVAWRPLYPWDAWIQWATKARVWYEFGLLAPFARSAEWFAAAGKLFFDASPEYPPTVPLWQVWMSLALGRFDDALMNAPWWMTAVMLAVAVYGAVRRLGQGPLAALAAAALVATLPLANVHVALAGYADLPLAAYYTVGTLAFVQWATAARADSAAVGRDWRDAAVALLLLAACTQIKNPGLAWVLTLAPGLAVALWPRHGLKLAAAGFVAAAIALALLAQAHPVVFNYRLHLDFEPDWAALGQSYFLLGNWNLLWYGAIVVIALAWRQLLSPALAAYTLTIAAGVLFLFIVFGFTNARAWVTDQTTVNRATLHFAPLVVVWMVLAFNAFAARWREAHPSLDVAGDAAALAAAGQAGELPAPAVATGSDAAAPSAAPAAG